MNNYYVAVRLEELAMSFSHILCAKTRRLPDLSVTLQVEVVIDKLGGSITWFRVYNHDVQIFESTLLNKALEIYNAL